MLVLSRRDVEALLDLDDLVDALADAMSDLSSGVASVPLRVAAFTGDGHGLLAAMPAYLPSAKALTAKLVSLFPDNNDRPTHQALICCFDPENGTPLAVMDGTYITAVRTAAGSALAMRLLARRDAEVVTVVGTGVQAAAHARALWRSGSIKRVVIAGRDAASAARLANELAADGINAQAAASIEDAAGLADVICAATHSPDPVIHRAWLRPGTHVNSVGYNSAGAGEVDAETVHVAKVFVESRDAALATPPAGAIELRNATETGSLNAAQVTEVGELLLGRATGRTSDDQLTLYKSVGVAVQDAAAANLVLRAALARGYAS